MDNSKGLGEERKSHYQLQKVDGCDFLWNHEKKTTKSTVGKKSIFCTLILVWLCKVTSSYSLPFSGEKGITTRDLEKYV